MKDKRIKYNNGGAVQYYKNFSSLENKNKNKNNIETGHYFTKKGIPGHPDIHEINFYIKKKF
tara:strand:+ start:120 stop:305 length:186 start_codon:yes stop_codon:yes gene_type:complete